MTTGFEAVLQERVEAMVNACTRCGACVKACPIATPAGVTAEPAEVIGGVIDVLRGEGGNAAAEAWATSCAMSGDCVRACSYGVNPRFLLAIARARLGQAAHPTVELRKRGVAAFRTVSRDVAHLSRMQLDQRLLERLGQVAEGRSTLGTGAVPSERPDFVFYTGCNVLKTPHIALLALDIMDALGVTYQVMGGPTHCCGVMRLRAGDTETYGRVAEATIEKLSQGKSGRVLSWCPSCYVQITEMSMPEIERMKGIRPFEMNPFILFVRDQLDRLRPMFCQSVAMRVALHRHPGLTGSMEAAAEILAAVPGIELVELGQPSAGLMSNYLSTLPEFKRELYRNELEAAAAAQVDALVTVYHPDHRELCAHEGEYAFRVVNLLEVIGSSMGFHQHDEYKRLKLLRDVEAIADDCADLARENNLDLTTLREVIADMLADQPVPIKKKASA
ncbi:MAG: heterodisulfide reductase-related iron-sulfur binding cluster [Actinomycetota bacterium]